jgi:hypothetical protein
MEHLAEMSGVRCDGKAIVLVWIIGQVLDRREVACSGYLGVALGREYALQ